MTLRQLGIGKPDYYGENTDVARASVWCTNPECGFEASGRFALVDLLYPEKDETRSLVLDREIGPVGAQY